MKPLWTTSCLLAHSFWSGAIGESLYFAVEYSKLENTERFMAHVDDALDACMRSADWLTNWKQSTFA
jgi:hypothetical protein